MLEHEEKEVKEKEEYRQLPLLIGEHELEPEDPTDYTGYLDKSGKKHRKVTHGKKDNTPHHK